MMSFEYIYRQLDSKAAIEYARDTVLHNPKILCNLEIEQIISKEILQKILRLDRNHNSLLHLAVQQNNLDSVKYILSHTAINPFLKNKENKTAFSLSQNPQITEYLISANLLIDENGTFDHELLKNKIALGDVYINQSTLLPSALSTLKSFNHYLKKNPHQKDVVLKRLQQYLEANKNQEKNNCFLFVQHLYDRLSGHSYGRFFNPPSYIKSDDSLDYKNFKAFLEEQKETLAGLLGILLNIRAAKEEAPRSGSINSSNLPGPPPNLDPTLGLILLPILCIVSGIALLNIIDEVTPQEEKTKRRQALEERERITIKQIDEQLKACFFFEGPEVEVDEKNVFQQTNLRIEAYANQVKHLATIVPQDFVFFNTKKASASQMRPSLRNVSEKTPLLDS